MLLFSMLQRLPSGACKWQRLHTRKWRHLVNHVHISPFVCLLLSVCLCKSADLTYMALANNGAETDPAPPPSVETELALQNAEYYFEVCPSVVFHCWKLSDSKQAFKWVYSGELVHDLQMKIRYGNLYNITWSAANTKRLWLVHPDQRWEN